MQVNWESMLLCNLSPHHESDRLKVAMRICFCQILE